jgi:anti-sigma B factor antagonist
LTYSIRSQSGPADSVIALSGDADAAAAVELDAAIGATVGAADAGSLVIIDLAEANFLDSRTIGVLATWQARIRSSGGRMAVVQAGPDMMRLFRMIGLEQTFEFFPTREAAAGSAS